MLDIHMAFTDVAEVEPSLPVTMTTNESFCVYKEQRLLLSM